MQWLLAFALAVLMAVGAIWPTYFWVRLARIPSPISLLVAPAVTFFLTTVLAPLFFQIHVGWFGTTVLPTLAAIGLVGFLVWNRANSGRSALPKKRAPRLHGRSRSTYLFLVLVILISWALATLPQILAGPPTNPVQQWDPTFHLNGLWDVTVNGDGRYGHSLANNYYPGEPTAYPDRWHTFVSLFATPTSAVFASNSSTLALTLLWIVGATVYTKILYPEIVAVFAAPVVAACTLGMPADALGAYNQWPNATSVALLPGLAALLLHLGTQVRKYLLRQTLQTGAPRFFRFASQSLIFLLGLIGAALAHPGIVFNLLVLLLPALVAGLAKLARVGVALRRVRLRPTWRTVIAVAAFPVTLELLMLITWAALRSPTVVAMGHYPRSGLSWATALETFLTPAPPFTFTFGYAAWVTVMAMLMLAGVVAVILWRKKIWPIFSFLTFSFLVLLAYSPNSYIRTLLTAPWFLDARRIMEPQNLAMVPLAAVGFAALCRWICTLWGYQKTRWQVSVLVAVAVLVVSGAGGLDTRILAARGVYDANALGKPGMANAGELEMLQSLDKVLPKDAVVIGDPQAGAAYAQVIGQRRAYFPQLMLPSSQTQDQRLLINSFKDINTDPRICQALKEEGITHFYQDSDGLYYGRARSKRMPGLYGVDTSKGFKLVAEGGGAKVWEITACK